jgi:hypothetical protein
MNFQVLWVSEAEEELAAIWIAAADRNAITTAAHVIDSTLRTDPQHAGESRDEDRRVLLERPLGVVFAVSPEDRTVHVLSVWRIEPRRDN